jgi:hypothetical protein
MADTSTATVTGVTGPGLALDAAVYQRIASVTINFQTNVLTLYFVEQNKGPLEVDVSEAATWTLTVTDGVYTLTVA